MTNDPIIAKYWEIVKQAHAEGAHRGCASTQVLIGAFESNGGNAIQAVMAAACTFGGKHAPVLGTMMFFNECMHCFEEHRNVVRPIKKCLESSQPVPGFGSSFAKEELDRTLVESSQYLGDNFPKESYVLQEIQDTILNVYEKQLFPNLAMFTAILFRLIHVPMGFVYLELVKLRIDAWHNILREQYQQSQTK